MKVRAITPIWVDEAELSRRQERYNRLAPPGWEFEVENLPAGSPEQLGSITDLRRSEEAGVGVALSHTANEAAAVMPDCVLDPGLTTLAQDAPHAVLGITRLSAGFLAALGVKFGVITRNRVIADEYEATVRRYGLAHLFGGSYVMDLSVEDISNTSLWNESVAAVAATASGDGVEVLINGCSAVEVTTTTSGVAVVDPTALALKVAALAAEEGLL